MKTQNTERKGSRNFVECFNIFNKQNQLIPTDGVVLAAVSGGIDSMAMLHLLHEAGVATAVAHCNFCLRGEESDGDEAFVKEQAARLGMTCHCTHFNTSEWAEHHGVSIQMAARELRYTWFNDLAEHNGYAAIAVAHHRDDCLETLFINLARGTGIRGLTGIAPRNGRVIRPMLFASRAEIAAFSADNHIAFREDSSNDGDKYARNYIRHHLLPALEGYFPGLRTSLERDICLLRGVEAFYREAIESYRSNVVVEDRSVTTIRLPALLNSPSPAALLYEILHPYGFADETAVAVLASPLMSGRRFFSPTHCLLCDRDRLLLTPLCADDAPSEIAIDANVSQIDLPNGSLTIEVFDKPHGYQPERSPLIACLDADRLKPPLTLRHWRAGDRFQPLGMTQSKKVSDFFTDRKLSLLDKDKTWLLTSAGETAWIVGLRIDERFKVTHETTRVAKLIFRVAES